MKVISMPHYRVLDLLYDGIGFPIYYESSEGVFYQEGGWIETQIDLYADQHLLTIFKEKQESICIDNSRMGIVLLIYK